jgi:hypothetical protein
MTITTSRTVSPAPSIEALELAVEDASLSDVMLCASAGLDAIVVDWSRFVSVEAAVETDTYRVDGDVASMVFGLAFQPAVGMPTLATVVVTAGTVEDRLVILGIDPAPLGSERNPVRVEGIPATPATDLPDWPTPVATMLATALADILSRVDLVNLSDPDDVHSTLDDVLSTARRALAFDRDRMRLRIDDHHGNRSFVQFVDGAWKAFANDGRRIRFSYCFGSHGPEDEIARDLSEATTIHEIQRAAMRHVRGLQDVQVEATFERHAWNGERFKHVQTPA